MNIIVLANRDLASNLALNRLLPTLAEEHTLQVYLSSQVGTNAALPRELSALRFFEQTLFDQILFPLLERAPLTGGNRSFTQLSEFTETPLATLDRVNSEESLNTLAHTQPDLLLCIRYGGILKDAAIAIPPLGVINLHSGLLPHYRGVMASFRAMLNGDTQLGTTVHYIQDAGIDTGDIIGTTRIELNPGRSYLWHVLHLYPAACELLANTVADLAAGNPVKVQKQPEGGAYYSFPGVAELERFREAGHSLYDVDEILDFTKLYLEPSQ